MLHITDIAIMTVKDRCLAYKDLCMLACREDFIMMVEFFSLRYKHLYTLYFILFQLAALFSCSFTL